MTELGHAGPGRGEVALGCFEVGGRAYALDVVELREVLRWQPATPLPGAPPLIEGVIDVRGDIVPVIDLGRVLGGRPAGSREGARIAVAQVGDLVLGLAVDAALGIVPVESEQLEAPPALANRDGCVGARAVVRRPGSEPIMLLSLESVIARVQGDAPAQAEGTR